MKLKSIYISDGGRCMAFKPDDDRVFLVGTDEGLVYKCTTEYSSQYLMTYPAHPAPIYNICWNTYVPTVFLTCASEWMVKMWDQDTEYVPLVAGSRIQVVVVIEYDNCLQIIMQFTKPMFSCVQKTDTYV